MGFMDKAKDLLNQHDDKVDQGLDKAGDAAKQRYAGHDEHIDQGVDRVQGMTGEGDTTHCCFADRCHLCVHDPREFQQVLHSCPCEGAG